MQLVLITWFIQKYYVYDVYIYIYYIYIYINLIKELTVDNTNIG